MVLHFESQIININTAIDVHICWFLKHFVLNYIFLNFRSLAPLWRTKISRENQEESVHLTSPLIITEAPKEPDPGNSCLPKWAVAAIKSPPLPTEGPGTEIPFASEELNLSTVSSSEEQNLMLLSSAMEDIENRRKQASM